MRFYSDLYDKRYQATCARLARMESRIGRAVQAGDEAAVERLARAMDAVSADLERLERQMAAAVRKTRAWA